MAIVLQQNEYISETRIFSDSTKLNGLRFVIKNSVTGAKRVEQGDHDSPELDGALSILSGLVNAAADAAKIASLEAELKALKPQFVLTTPSLAAVLDAWGIRDQAIAALDSVQSGLFVRLLEAGVVDLVQPIEGTDPAVNGEVLLAQFSKTKEEVMAHELAKAV